MLESPHVATGAATARHPPCIHLWFESQAQRTPDARAIKCGIAQLTYAELNARANILAQQLRRCGVGPDVLVALYLERSVEIVVGLLGILKAGGAYVPIDPENPAHRTQFVLDDAGARVIVTDSSLRERLRDNAARILCLDTFDWDDAAGKQNPAHSTGPENLAYAIYTSGSTGKPKGTLVTHRNVVRLFSATQAWFGFGPDDVWSVFHSFAFDFSVWELWGALHCGGQAVIVPAAVARSPEAFHDLLREERITVLCQTPSAFYPLVDVDRAKSPGAPLALRLVIFGGEALEFRRLKPWLDHHGERPKLVNMYGITETTVHTTYFEISADRLESGSIIGVPLPDLRIHLLDENRVPVASGATGEIHVGGPGVARGYLNRLDLTRERFIPDPYSAEEGARLYRSGDLAREMPDGQLEFRGRIDNQIKLRGYRIELGEIEAALGDCAGVCQAVVVVQDGPSGDRELVAYVTADKDAVLSPSRLRAELSAILPMFMVPSAFVVLERWPLTPNGKLDRDALAAPRREDRVALPIAPPRTDTEMRVAAIWAEALAIDQVGIYDDYFELGVHSLMATRICVRLRTSFDAPLSILDVLSARNVATLAGVIDAMPRGDGRAGELALNRGARDGRLPTSFGQDTALYFHELAPGNLAYNNQVNIRFSGNLDVPILERSLTEIVRRHESLRTTFERVGAAWRQVIHPPWTVTLPVCDATPAQLPTLFAHRFDPSRLPLLVWTLIRTAPGEHLLVHVEHHLIHDGWSFGVFVQELIALYTAYLGGEASPLTELPVQFSDFAAWQRDLLQGDRLDALLSFWKERLAAPLPVLDLPTDRARPAIQHFRGDEVQSQLPARLTSAMRGFAHARGYSLFSVMLAGFFALLHRYSRQSDLIVGAGYANRERKEAEALIGMIVNMLPLRMDLADDPCFGDLVARVQAVARSALEHQALPFDLIVRSVGVPHDPSRNPLCQVAFSFHDAPVPPVRLPGLVGEIDYPHNGSAKFDMNIIVVPHAEQQIGAAALPEDDRITIKWDFNTDIFDLATVQGMLGRYLCLLEAGIADPSVRVSDIDLVDDAARRRLMAYNETAREYPRERSIGALFEEQAAASSAKPALVFGDTSLSYRELNERANRLAHYLRARGVGPEVKVGICIDRSLEMVAAILGILKAGGAYVPLDPEYPRSRLEFMLRDTQAPVLVTQSRLRASLPAFAGTIICIDDEWDSIARESASNPAIALTSGNLAYVMYTSGSTGVPKGVCIEHRSVVRLVRNTNYVTITTEDILLQLASISFDASTFELWGSLLNGATLVVPPPGVPSLAGLAKMIRDREITTLWLTAALFHQMVDSELDALLGVRQVLAGGEALSVAHVHRMLDALPPGHRLINGYGPTENTTFSCCHVMERGSPIGRTVAIGKPIANTQAYVLDERQSAVPEGVPGELYLGGDGLAREYLNQRGLTAERFVVVQGRRLYRSGDRARQLMDGSLEFLGRTDDQIKLRGYRIEPGEIESALVRHPSVRECVVLPVTPAKGDKRLAAYIVGQKDGPASPDDLRRFLRETLPEHMVPSDYVAIDRIPLTEVGKIDRKALPQIAEHSLAAPIRHIEPRTPAEQDLWNIWAEHLGRSDFGIEDNFFDLGGHSLVAAGIFSEINARFGVTLPLSTLFGRPTIASLAQALPQGHEHRGARILIPVQPAGSKPPIFAMLGIGGSYVAYATLTRALGKDQPFFSLEMPGLEGEGISHGRIEDVAARLREEMHAVTANEPCVLIGACAGALVVFELAQRLTADGVAVKLLIMLDPPPTGVKRTRRLSSHRIWRQLVLPRFLLGRARLYLRDLATREVSLGDFLKEKVSVAREILTKRDLFRASRHEIQITRVLDATSAALTTYVPRPYGGRVALLLGDRYAPDKESNPVFDWRAVCTGSFDVGSVSGKDTGAMLRPPHVEVLIARLESLLRDL